MDSYHIYERHFDLVKGMISEEFTPVPFPIVNARLITENGTPCGLLKLLETHHKDEFMVSDDLVYSWIQNNMKDEVTV